MKCIFCDKSVFGGNCVTVPNKGPSHLPCFQAYEMQLRSFMGINITTLTDSELTDLKDIVLSEENSRNRSHTDEVSLF